MVKGISTFIEHFKGFEKHYRIIGGTACDVFISENGFTPRATNDIDLLIVIEVYDAVFNAVLWNFIAAAGYKSLQKEASEQKFYRFSDPSMAGYPEQIELLCRNSGIIKVPEDRTIISVSSENDLSHLSAIILEDEYYTYTLNNSHIVNGIHIAGVNALICLKAYAYINMETQKQSGMKFQSKEIEKHWRDVMRLTVLLRDTDTFYLPQRMRNDLSDFIKRMKTKNPDVRIFLKSMGISNITLEDLLNQLEVSFLR